MAILTLWELRESIVTLTVQTQTGYVLVGRSRPVPGVQGVIVFQIIQIAYIINVGITVEYVAVLKQSISAMLGVSQLPAAPPLPTDTLQEVGSRLGSAQAARLRATAATLYLDPLVLLVGVHVQGISIN